MHQDATVLAVGMNEAARRLGLSVRTIANLVSRKELASQKVGRRRLVSVAALEDFVNQEQQPRKAPQTGRRRK